MSNCHWRGSIGKQIRTVAETESQTFFRESINGRSQSMFSPWTWRDSMWRWVEERLKESKTMPEDLGPLNQLTKAHRDWNCKHRACMDLYQFLCTNVRAVALVFLWYSKQKRTGLSRTLLPTRISFLLLELPCPASIWGLSPSLNVSLIFGYILVLSLGDLYLLWRKWRSESVEEWVR